MYSLMSHSELRDGGNLLMSGLLPSWSEQASDSSSNDDGSSLLSGIHFDGASLHAQLTPTLGNISLHTTGCTLPNQYSHLPQPSLPPQAQPWQQLLCDTNSSSSKWNPTCDSNHFGVLDIDGKDLNGEFEFNQISNAASSFLSDEFFSASQLINNGNMTKKRKADKEMSSQQLDPNIHPQGDTIATAASFLLGMNGCGGPLAQQHVKSSLMLLPGPQNLPVSVARFSHSSNLAKSFAVNNNNNNVNMVAPPSTTKFHNNNNAPQQGASGSTEKSESGDYSILIGERISSNQMTYEVIAFLGRGTFGQVVKCRCLDKTGNGSSGQDFVAMKILKNHPSYQRQGNVEISILQLLSRENTAAYNIVSAIEFFQHQSHTCLVFELLQQNLYDYLKAEKFVPMALSDIRVITQQVLVALSKLKQLGLIHADLKPENIMLVDPPPLHLKSASISFRVKVIDFGSACHSAKAMPNTYLQSRYYRAPEILLGVPFNEAIDMWSLGCVCAELFLGWPIYPGSSEYDQMRYIVETQGLPPYRMLQYAVKHMRYFHMDSQGNYRLKVPAEHTAETGQRTKETRKYVLPSLETMEDAHLVTRTVTDTRTTAVVLDEGLSPAMLREPQQLETYIEACDRREFAQLLCQMLHLDLKERAVPDSALQHPFITMQHLLAFSSRSYGVQEAIRKMRSVCPNHFGDNCHQMSPVATFHAQTQSAVQFSNVPSSVQSVSTHHHVMGKPPTLSTLMPPHVNHPPLSDNMGFDMLSNGSNATGCLLQPPISHNYPPLPMVGQQQMALDPAVVQHLIPLAAATWGSNNVSPASLVSGATSSSTSNFGLMANAGCPSKEDPSAALLWLLQQQQQQFAVEDHGSGIAAAAFLASSGGLPPLHMSNAMLTAENFAPPPGLQPTDVMQTLNLTENGMTYTNNLSHQQHQQQHLPMAWPVSVQPPGLIPVSQGNVGVFGGQETYHSNVDTPTATTGHVNVGIPMIATMMRPQLASVPRSSHQLFNHQHSHHNHNINNNTNNIGRTLMPTDANNVGEENFATYLQRAAAMAAMQKFLTNSMVMGDCATTEAVCNQQQWLHDLQVALNGGNSSAAVSLLGGGVGNGKLNYPPPFAAATDFHLEQAQLQAKLLSQQQVPPSQLLAQQYATVPNTFYNADNVLFAKENNNMMSVPPGLVCPGGANVSETFVLPNGGPGLLNSCHPMLAAMAAASSGTMNTSTTATTVALAPPPPSMPTFLQCGVGVGVGGGPSQNLGYASGAPRGSSLSHMLTTASNSTTSHHPNGGHAFAPLLGSGIPPPGFMLPASPALLSMAVRLGHLRSSTSSGNLGFPGSGMGGGMTLTPLHHHQPTIHHTPLLHQTTANSNNNSLQHVLLPQPSHNFNIAGECLGFS